MKKLIKLVLSVAVTAILFPGCVKLYEEVIPENIERPNYDIDIPINPDWDTIQPENNINHGK